jgi:hypothetical protein
MSPPGEETRKGILLAGLAVPKWHELSRESGKRDTAGYSLHCKEVGQLSLLEVANLPSHSETVRRDFIDATKWLLDPGQYENCIPRYPTKPSRMTRKEIRQMLKNGKCEALYGRARGFCRVFKVPEHQKRRFRVIEHPEAINEQTALDHKTEFLTTTERHNAVLKGKFVADLDFAAYFDQFLLAEEVRDFFAFDTGDRWFRMKVLAMGLKHSVRVAHATTLQLLNFKVGKSVHVEPYIDNIRVVGETREEVISVVAEILMRCAKCGVTVNEVNVKEIAGPDERRIATLLATQLVKSEGDWLGETYDYVNKTVAMSTKTREKMERVFTDRNMTFRQVIANFAMLIYATRTYNLSLSTYFAARRAHSLLSRLLGERPELWDRQAIDFCPHVVRNIQQWKNDLLASKPRTIRKEEKPTMCLITDACEVGWAAYFRDSTGREYHHAEKWSQLDHAKGFTAHSAQAEPEGAYRGICRFIKPNTDAVLLHGSDSKTAIAIAARGFSNSFFANTVASRLHRNFPKLRMKGVHIPGTQMTGLVDRTSRDPDSELSVEEWGNCTAWADKMLDAEIGESTSPLAAASLSAT